MIGRPSQLRGRSRLGDLLTDTKASAEQFEHERNRFDALKASAPVVVDAYQLFPTPPALARRVVGLAVIEDGHRVLEPSAGTGNLLRVMADTNLQYSAVAVEINRDLASELCSMQRKGLQVDRVYCRDFLECSDLGQFDRIVMNPPFTRGSDIRHIRHALTMLKPGGRLVSLCANGPKQRQQLRPIASEWIDLPAGSFKESGTNVESAIVIFEG